MTFEIGFPNVALALRSAAVAFAVLALGACSSEQARNAANSLATGAPAALGDIATVAQIEAKLVRIDADSSLHVAVSSHDGAVRLSGRVKSASVATRFEAAAKSISGVKSVDAALKVDSTLAPASGQARDAGTIAAVTGDLVAQAGINAFHVKVSAHGGVVTLTGSAKTGALRQTMLDAAKHAPGVKSVIDKIEIKE